MQLTGPLITIRHVNHHLLHHLSPIPTVGSRNSTAVLFELWPSILFFHPSVYSSFHPESFRLLLIDHLTNLLFHSSFLLTISSIHPSIHPTILSLIKSINLLLLLFHAFIHPFIYPVVQSFIHSHLNELIDSSLNVCTLSSVILLSIHPYINSFIHSFIQSSTHAVTLSCIHLPIYVFTGWCCDCTTAFLFFFYICIYIVLHVCWVFCLFDPHMWLHNVAVSRSRINVKICRTYKSAFSELKTQKMDKHG